MRWRGYRQAAAPVRRNALYGMERCIGAVAVLRNGREKNDKSVDIRNGFLYYIEVGYEIINNTTR
ncbi:hypothetical protein D3C80_2153230 [compost metagenome]